MKGSHQALNVTLRDYFVARIASQPKLAEVCPLLLVGALLKIAT